ncbi:hypothetical protein B0I35DRAFT_433782 [Stachybotrys elegans]|uniref:Uncharacterized protein n=1 Tax=Stachybotrys elegans TaxID=80388 RepID=A0A8K0SKB1_9HYPO|nr:hypothetical protein B0I35DRAFT_433782 [Stachybotrys elegans]
MPCPTPPPPAHFHLRSGTFVSYLVFWQTALAWGLAVRASIFFPFRPFVLANPVSPSVLYPQGQSNKRYVCPKLHRVRLIVFPFIFFHTTLQVI